MNQEETLKYLQLEQMEVFARILTAYDEQIKLNSSILNSLTLADFRDKDYVQSLYNAIQNATVAAGALERAFKAYAESHMLKLVDINHNS
jgi:hypothetical protein